MIYLTCTEILFLSFWVFHRPTQSIIYVPLQANRFPKLIYLPFSTIFKILFRRLYSPVSDPPHKIMRYWVYYSTQLSYWFRPDRNLSGDLICFGGAPGLKRLSAGPALKHFTWFIGAGGLPSPRSGRIYRFNRLTVPMTQSLHLRYRFVSLFFFLGLESTSQRANYIRNAHRWRCSKKEARKCLVRTHSRNGPWTYECCFEVNVFVCWKCIENVNFVLKWSICMLILNIGNVVICSIIIVFMFGCPCFAGVVLL